ncbi:asparagine synthase-related protein [Halomicrococcus sp. SG-WS-1]|uniref:asparagine synthase-related protein n=1 Tax=Halomicrococcus sp. SG-WS-1 TaxID=3439057 RepID=UPI003F7B0EC8
MPGITGGTVDRRSLEAMADSMVHEAWYETDDVIGRRYGLATVNHGEKDPNGHTVWSAGRRSGVLHGVISNRKELGMSTGEIFQAVLDRPNTILPRLAGPFVLACADQRGSLVVATDKLATRPCYYAADGGFLFGTELKALLTRLRDVQLNIQAVSDLLLTGSVMGRKTLLAEIQSLEPGSYIQYSDGVVSRDRYWTPAFGTAPEEGYVERTVDRYRESVANVVDTVDGDLGLWLSSGLDSRTMASVIADEVDSFTAFTYGSHWGKDCAGAEQVADILDVPHHVSEYTPEGCVDAIENGVELVDGMNQWSYYVNLPAATSDVPSNADVLFEACAQGEFFGENYFSFRWDSPTETLYDLKRQLSAQDVQALLTEDVDPKRSFETLLERSAQRDGKSRLLDVNWQLYANGHFRGNKLYRSKAGTRVPFSHGPLLDHLAKLPVQAYQRPTVPLIESDIPYGISPLKLQVMRAVGGDVNRIPYDRTGFAPATSNIAHAIGFTTKQAKKRLLGARDTMQGKWYRDHPEMRSFLDELLDAACDRQLFDGDVVRDYQRAHLDGETDNITAISAITTLEYWRQTQLEQQDTAKVTVTAK